MPPSSGALATAVFAAGTAGGGLLGLAVSDGTVLVCQPAPRSCGAEAMSCGGLAQVVLLDALSLSYASNVMLIAMCVLGLLGYCWKSLFFPDSST